MNDLGKLFTSTGEEQDDGSWEFSQLGQPLSFTELTALVDLPLGIKAYQDVDLTMNFPIGRA